MEERTIVDANGVKVFTRWWAIDHSRAVVLVSHGAEHSGRYDRFAHAVNDAGIAAVALDHRGPDEPPRRPAPVSWARADAEPSSTTCTSSESLHFRPSATLTAPSTRAPVMNSSTNPNRDQITTHIITWMQAHIQRPLPREIGQCRALRLRPGFPL